MTKPRLQIISAIPGTVAISLTKGFAAIVDSVDRDLATWHFHAFQRKNVVYARTKASTLLHRVIMARVISRDLEFDEVVDHINGDGLDNRRSNLRVCTQAENCRNQRTAKNNTSGAKGVYRSSDKKKWVARIKVNYRLIYLGTFDTVAEAAAARASAEFKYYGEFSSLHSTQLMAQEKAA